VSRPSCGDWLSVLQPHLHAPLFHPEGTERLFRVARRLPGDLLTVLEIRLAADAAPIDLSLRLSEPGEARRTRWTLEAVPVPHLRSLLSRWAEGTLPPVDSVWLEFDVGLEEIPPPVTCAKLQPDAPLAWLIDTLFPALHGKPLTGPQERLVRLCHESIPPPAYLLYVFSLLARGTDTLRLELFGLDPAGIAAFLDRVAPGTVAWVADTAALFEGVERIHLSLDLGEEILPRIGIEGSFSRLPTREPGWRELLDRLVARGLCRPDEREAALAWPGYDTFRTAPQSWPAEAALRDVCFRRLSHVKVVCRPDRAPEAKLYLLFGVV
jgi:hypothetical protein